MILRYATQGDWDPLKNLDLHVDPVVLSQKIGRREIIVASDKAITGWLRFGFFWDHIPFINMIYLLEGYRKQSLGTQLVRFWEKEMSARGFSRVMTSALSSEQAQHFYRKLGYQDIGGFVLPPEPYEIIFHKVLVR